MKRHFNYLLFARKLAGKHLNGTSENGIETISLRKLHVDVDVNVEVN